MKTTKKATPPQWTEISVLAECLNCSGKYLRDQGHKGMFGFKRVGPRRFLAFVPEVVDFYTKRYPDIEINRAYLDSLMQSTA